MSGNQSRYKEIVQGGVEQDKIDCVYLFFAKKMKKKNIREILCNFLVRMLQCFEKKNVLNLCFAHENMKNRPLNCS